MNIAEILSHKFPEHMNHFAVWDDNGNVHITWDETAIGRPKPTQAELVAWERELPSDLDKAISAHIREIDAKTSELIKRGFTFAGKQFSMSDNAQKNWTMLAAARANGMMQYPYPISTLNESVFYLQSDEAMLGFLAAYATYQADPTQPLGSGRTLKAQVAACATVGEVEAIVDDRE